MFVKPKKGLKVRKPDGSYLKESGESVDRSVYWRRLLNREEIEEVKVLKKTKKKTEQESE